MRRSLVSVVVLFVFLFSSPNGVVGQDIPLPEKINVDTDAKFQVTPRSLCVTEDGIFLFPDYQAAAIKVFNKEGNYLKFIKDLGPQFGNETFTRPLYCFYSRNEAKLGVIDYGVRKVFIFDRLKKVEFTPIEIIDCPRVGYDMEFNGKGDQLLVSGYLTDEDGNPFDLYRIHIDPGEKDYRKVDYLLPSYQKYNLNTPEDYIIEYRQKQTLPAIGYKAFIDVLGDDLFLVWEGALRIIKINLASRGITTWNGRETPYYTKPVGSRLNSFYKIGDFEALKKEHDAISVATNIFTTPRHIFLVYRTARDNNDSTFRYRLQTFTPEGNYRSDVLISGNPGQPMWFDKEGYELYAVSSGNDNGEFSILKYKINQ